MTRYLRRLAWLLLAWLAFWRDLSAANVLSGLALGAALLALFPLPPPHPGRRLRPLPLLQLIATSAWSVARANVVVAWEVVTPRNRIHEGVVAVPLTTVDPAVITVVSHALILAPGTMVIEIDRDPETVLFIHVLHLRSAEALTREVQQLERLTISALGGATRPVAGRPT